MLKMKEMKQVTWFVWLIMEQSPPVFSFWLIVIVLFGIYSQNKEELIQEVCWKQYISICKQYWLNCSGYVGVKVSFQPNEPSPYFRKIPILIDGGNPLFLSLSGKQQKTSAIRCKQYCVKDVHTIQHLNRLIYQLIKFDEKYLQPSKDFIQNKENIYSNKELLLLKIIN